jgi:hypothetical protein
MPNTTVPAAAEGLPQINRRRLLLGLAAASTAAAAFIVDAVAAPVENPKLLALAAELPAIAEASRVAYRAYKDMAKRWSSATPWAPDELTVPGTAWPTDDFKQPGDAELKALGGYLWRKGDEFPRRIVVKSWQVYGDLLDARRQKRQAKKIGSLTDFAHYEDEEMRLKKLLATAKDYEAKFRRVRTAAKADHERLWPAKDSAREALENHVAAIMDSPDWTMEGLVIKAQALAEWDRVDEGFEKLAFKHGHDWHGQIATSILRHALGGAA